MRSTRRGRRSAGDLIPEVSVLRWPSGRTASGVFEMFSAEETGWFGTAGASSFDPGRGENVLLVSASTRDDPAAPAVLLSLVNTSPSEAVKLSMKLGGPAPKTVTGTILTAPPRVPRQAVRRGTDAASPARPRPFRGALLQGRVVGVTVPARSVVVLTVSQ